MCLDVVFLVFGGTPEALSTAALQDKFVLHCHKVDHVLYIINALQNVCFILQPFCRVANKKGM